MTERYRKMTQCRFDFGIGNAAEGFMKVIGSSIYSDKSGYGIEKETYGVKRDGGDKEVLRDYLDFSGNKFTVRLENGKYRVRIHTGDYSDEGDVTSHFYVNGEDIDFWVHDSTVENGEIICNVKNGVLNIQADEGKHVCLNAVEISPATELQEVKIRSHNSVSAEKQSVMLDWDRVEGAAAYRVRRKCLRNNETDITEDITSETWNDDTAKLCERYEYSVSPLDAYGFECASASKATVYVTDGNKVSDCVSEFIAVSKENSVELSWKGTDGILYYNLYRKAPLGIPIYIAAVDRCSFIDENANTCIPFEYMIEGVTTSGLTNRASVSAEPVSKPPLRNMETLNRGAVAVKTEKGVFVSWRLKGCEYDKDISFLVYRNGEKITDSPITDRTCMQDDEGNPGDRYTIKAVKGNKAEKYGETVTASEFEYIPIKLDKPEPYTTPDGNVYEYCAHDVIPADLDGDGEYEFVVKWLANPKDNSHKGYTGVYYVDAYKMDGTKLWRIDLGVNIRAGAHYAQIMVYDFDSDGKAELICKTADGTRDSADNVIGDPDADYRNSDGFILEGPEYLSAFDGETGVLLDTVPYEPPRGNVRDWGDSWGNRVDRFLACVAYLDGINPSVVMCRGYYGHGCPTVLAAYDLVDKKLKKKWVFRADKNQNIEYTAQGNHNLGVGDTDGDYMDEIVYGGMSVDHDGRGIYSTGLGHGDGMHLGKFMPHEPGLNFFGIHEEDDAELGYEVRNPGTGEIKWGRFTGRDTARGMCAKIDPRYEGNQVWARDEELFTFNGEIIREKAPKTCKFPIWWDGDLLRELLDYDPDDDIWQNGRPKVLKWDWKKMSLKPFLSRMV